MGKGRLLLIGASTLLLALPVMANARPGGMAHGGLRIHGGAGGFGHAGVRDKGRVKVGGHVKGGGAKIKTHEGNKL